MLRGLRYLLSIFNMREKIVASTLMGFIFILTLLETAGIGALFPYIKLLSDPSIIEKNSKFSSLYHHMSFQSERNFLIFLGLLIFSVILVKSVGTIVSTYCQFKFRNAIKIRLSRLGIMHYMMMPYIKLTDINTGLISKHLLLEIANTSTALGQIFQLSSALLTTAFLFSLVLFINAKVTVSLILAFITICFVLVGGTKKLISKMGVQSAKISKELYQFSQQIVLGIKDVRCFNAENYFSEKFVHYITETGKIDAREDIISASPAIILNLTVFSGVLFSILYFLIEKKDIVSVLPLLGVIALSVQRITPSINMIYTTTVKIRRQWPGVCIVKDTLIELDKMMRKNKDREEINVTFSRVIQVKNLTYRYPRSHQLSLIDINLALFKNHSYGFVGHSGSGKSTFLNILIGLLSVDNDVISIDDYSLKSNQVEFLRRIISYVPQKIFLMDGTIAENIAFGKSKEEIDEEKVYESLRLAQLGDFINSLPGGIHTPIGEDGVKISGGQRQRIGIARALYKPFDILILDEATNALDAKTEHFLITSLLHTLKNKTIIMVTHRVSSLEFCDEIVVFDNGRIQVQGTYSNLLENNVHFQELSRITA